jgi:hypothetical protein
MLPIKNGLKKRRCFIAIAFQLLFRIHQGWKSQRLNQDGLKLNGTHQLLVYSDDVNIFG